MAGREGGAAKKSEWPPRPTTETTDTTDGDAMGIIGQPIAERKVIVFPFC